MRDLNNLRAGSGIWVPFLYLSAPLNMEQAHVQSNGKSGVREMILLRRFLFYGLIMGDRRFF